MKIDQDKYVVVTGGAGFIGSSVIKELNNRGCSKILVADILEKGDKWKNLLGKAFFEVIHKDALLNWLLEKEDEVQAIIHLGACADTVESDCDYLLENNFAFTKKLAEFAIHRGIRFVYASSAATYGDGSQGFSDDHNDIEKLRPLNMYGYSKQLFDLWLLHMGYLDRCAGLKYFNVYGPNEWHKGRMASAIVGMVSSIQKTGYIKLFQSRNPQYKDGEQKRDFIYVKDAASCTIDLMLSDDCGIFNVGTGVASTWNRLARAVFSSMNIPEKIEYVPMPDDLAGKYQYFTEAKVEKLEKALKRKCTHFTLEEAVSDYVNGYLIKESRW